MPEKKHIVFGEKLGDQHNDSPTVDALIKKIGGIIAEGGTVAEGFNPDANTTSEPDPIVEPVVAHTPHCPDNASQ